MNSSPRIGLERLVIASIVSVAIVAAALSVPRRAHGTSGATLTALSFHSGTLSPSFDSGTTGYVLTGLTNSDSELTFTATPSTGYEARVWAGNGTGFCPLHSGVWVTNGSVTVSDTGAFTAPLKVGRNILEISIIEPDNPDTLAGSANRYSITVVRPGTMSISGPTAVSHPENETGEIGTYSVPDATGTIRWFQDGEDGLEDRFFSMGASSGTLSFASSVNYENPWDCDRDNVYKVTLTAYEGSVLVAQLDVAVTVTDVDETQWGLPAITGTAQVGQTLTADTSAIRDTDGLENVSYSYQWLADDTEIDGATSSTYTVQSSDNGKVMTLRVTFSDDGGTEYSLASDGTAEVNTPATGAPTITGTAQCGAVLTASTTGIADSNGLTNVSYSYQWLADDTDIDGATSSTYTVRSSDQDKVIKVRVSFIDDGGNDESLTSDGTSAVVLGGL